MKQFLIVFAFLVAGTSLASETSEVMIRCSTDKNGGNFSVLVAALALDEINGELTRGVNLQEAGPVSAVFPVAVRNSASSPDSLLTFHMAGTMTMSTPYERVSWNNVTFIVDKSLMQLRRGGMIEMGQLSDGSDYEYVYKCVTYLAGKE